MAHQTPTAHQMHRKDLKLKRQLQQTRQLSKSTGSIFEVIVVNTRPSFLQFYWNLINLCKLTFHCDTFSLVDQDAKTNVKKCNFAVDTETIVGGTGVQVTEGSQSHCQILCVYVFETMLFKAAKILGGHHFLTDSPRPHVLRATSTEAKTIQRTTQAKRLARKIRTGESVRGRAETPKDDPYDPPSSNASSTKPNATTRN